jgi:hypothetical protein
MLRVSFRQLCAVPPRAGYCLAGVSIALPTLQATDNSQPFSAITSDAFSNISHSKRRQEPKLGIYLSCTLYVPSPTIVIITTSQIIRIHQRSGFMDAPSQLARA